MINKKYPTKFFYLYWKKPTKFIYKSTNFENMFNCLLREFVVLNLISNNYCEKKMGNAEAKIIPPDNFHNGTIEYYIFDTAFNLMEQNHVEGTQGIQQRFRTEAERTSNGLLQWNRIYPNLNTRGNGYLAALEHTQDLLIIAARNRVNPNNNTEFTYLSGLISTNIELRRTQLQHGRDRGDNQRIIDGDQAAITVWTRARDRIVAEFGSGCIIS